MALSAVIGLVMALVACCPFVSLAGAMVGAMAYRRIVASGGQLRGRRVALAAMFAGISLGLAGGVAWLWMSNSVQTWLHESVVQGVRDSVVAAQAGDDVKALRPWQPRSRPAQADLERFRTESLGRFGAFREFRITSFVRSGSALAASIDVAGTFVFESREVPGSASFELTPGTSSLWPQLQMTSLVVDDAIGGDLRLTSRSGSTTMPAMAAPSTRPAP